MIHWMKEAWRQYHGCMFTTGSIKLELGSYMFCVWIYDDSREVAWCECSRLPLVRVGISQSECEGQAYTSSQLQFHSQFDSWFLTVLSQGCLSWVGQVSLTQQKSRPEKVLLVSEDCISVIFAVNSLTILLKISTERSCLDFSFHLLFLCCLDIPSPVMELLGSTEEKHYLMCTGHGFPSDCCAAADGWIWNWQESSQQFSSNFSQMPFRVTEKRKSKCL